MNKPEEDADASPAAAEAPVTSNADMSDAETSAKFKTSTGTDSVASAEDTAMERLFTQEEIVSMRTSIQTFVRREFKRAMVGALKELLSEFDE